jgi:hypothetical protein
MLKRRCSSARLRNSDNAPCSLATRWQRPLKLRHNDSLAALSLVSYEYTMPVDGSVTVI